VASATEASKLEHTLRSEEPALRALRALVAEPFRVETPEGRVLWGDLPDGGAPHPIVTAGAEVGAVFGGRGGEDVARVLGRLHEREHEAQRLVVESVARHDELSLLYDLGETLSRVLEVDEAAEIVCAQALRFLGAEDVCVLLRDRRGLRPVASLGESSSLANEERRAKRDTGRRGSRRMHSASAERTTAGAPPAMERSPGHADELAARVLESGETVLERHDGRAVICAPLRAQETILGVLRVSGEALHDANVKLVTSLASHGATAMSHALLHREQLRQQAMRNQIERFVSPMIADAMREDAPEMVRKGEPVAMLFAELRHVGYDSARVAPDALAARALEVGSVILHELLRRGAMVDAPQPEMVVAVFARRRFATAIDDAIEAARAIADRAAVGVVAGTLVDARGFVRDVSRAATLQSRADGRIVVDARCAEELGDRVRTFGEVFALEDVP